MGGWTEGSTEVQFIGDDLYNRVTLGGMVHNDISLIRQRFTGFCFLKGTLHMEGHFILPLKSIYVLYVLSLQFINVF